MDLLPGVLQRDASVLALFLGSGLNWGEVLDRVL